MTLDCALCGEIFFLFLVQFLFFRVSMVKRVFRGRGSAPGPGPGATRFAFPHNLGQACLVSRQSANEQKFEIASFSCEPPAFPACQSGDTPLTETPN